MTKADFNNAYELHLVDAWRNFVFLFRTSIGFRKRFSPLKSNCHLEFIIHPSIDILLIDSLNCLFLDNWRHPPAHVRKLVIIARLRDNTVQGCKASIRCNLWLFSYVLSIDFFEAFAIHRTEINIVFGTALLSVGASTRKTHRKLPKAPRATSILTTFFSLSLRFSFKIQMATINHPIDGTHTVLLSLWISLYLLHMEICACGPKIAYLPT